MFERLMERVLVNIPCSRCIVYLDDLLVHGGNFDSALSHLSEAFSTIRQAGLRLNSAGGAALLAILAWLPVPPVH